MTRRLTRRGVLRAGLASLAFAGAGALPGCRRSHPGERVSAALRGWLDDDAAWSVGRRVLERGAGWNDASTLLAAVAPALGDAETPEQARAALARRVREELRAGRVVTLDGWRLSETEARLYALAALERGRKPR